MVLKYLWSVANAAAVENPTKDQATNLTKNPLNVAPKDVQVNADVPPEKEAVFLVYFK